MNFRFISRFFTYQSRILAFVITLVGLAAMDVRGEIRAADYRTTAQNHRLRIVAGARYVFSEFRARFSELNLDLIESYLSLHDLPKLMTKDQLINQVSKQELNQYSFLQSEDIASVLGDYYGLNERQIRALGEGHYERFHQARELLNKIEDRMKERFFMTRLRGLSGRQFMATRKQLRELEEYVDFTDTKVFRRDEVADEGKTSEESLREFVGSKYQELRGNQLEFGAVMQIFIGLHSWMLARAPHLSCVEHLIGSKPRIRIQSPASLPESAY